MDCKRAYVKLSNERDTIKNMFADSLFRHRFERTFWAANTKKQVKVAKATGRKQGALLVLIPEIILALYWVSR